MLLGDSVSAAFQATESTPIASAEQTAISPAHSETPGPTLPPTGTATVTPAQATRQPAQKLPHSTQFDCVDIETRFYYHQLTDKQKEIFAVVYDGIMDFDTEIHLPDNYLPDDLERAMFALRNDCPEIFQWDGHYAYQYTTTDTAAYCGLVAVEYRLSEAEYRQYIEQTLESIQALKNLPDFGTTAYENELAIYRNLLAICIYDSTKPYNDSAFSPYINGYAKCDGYAKALVLSLRSYGIRAAEVGGMADDTDTGAFIGHSWIYGFIEGYWYQCDPTWDDSQWSDSMSSGAAYLPYFNIDDSTMLRTHVIQDEFLAWGLPVCDSLDANYYNRSGLRIQAGADLTLSIHASMDAAYQKGQSNLALAFSTRQDYETALLQLEPILLRWNHAGTVLKTWRYTDAADGLLIYIYSYEVE